jgi:basic amino acid/polyamine antiporter, APA family
MGFSEVQLANFELFAGSGAAAIFSTAGFVFVAYGGLLKIASLSGEVKDPGRVIPRGMLVSLLLVIVLYTLMVFVTSGVLPREQLDGSLTPISDGAAVFMGKAAPLLALAAILAFVSTANAGLMAASRYIFATSRDGLLPPVFSRVNRRFGTPHVAILVTGLFIALSLFLQLEVLVKAASTVLLITYILVSLSIIVLRESRLHNYRPLFRCPFYPWVQLAGIAGYGFLLLEMGRKSFFITMVMIAAGLLSYIFYGRFRAKKESALMHLVDRITARELGRKGLESELKEIVRERDLVVQDRFDHVIEESLVLDLAGPLGLEEFLGEAAAVWLERLPLKPEEIKAAFLERERQSTTVLSPGLAIPHIILPGEGIFDILIARCLRGVRFTEENEPVRTIFMLAGTLDQRNFYLRALAAIAQIFQGMHFEKRWRDARNPQALRDLVLLSRRRRDS